jgi:hypothetical protein
VLDAVWPNIRDFFERVHDPPHKVLGNRYAGGLRSDSVFI